MGAAKTLCSPACSACERLRAAALAIVDRDGIDAVTTERLADEAGVPVSEVLEHYSDPATCLYETYDEVADRIFDEFASAFAVRTGWRMALRSAARRVLERMASRHAEARFYFVEVLRGDHELLSRHLAARARMVELFARELGRRVGVGQLPHVQVELLIGAGFHAVSAAVADGRTEELPGLQRELVSRAYVFQPIPG